MCLLLATGYRLQSQTTADVVEVAIFLPPTPTLDGERHSLAERPSGRPAVISPSVQCPTLTVSAHAQYKFG